jgi:glycosyltransferase involved in cell wall biosynthesis
MPEGLNVIGYDDESGLGQIARLVVETLRQAGIPYGVVPIGRRFRWRREARPNFDTNLFCVNAQMLPGLVETLGASFFRERRTIAFWWWEVDRFPAVMSWASHLVDEIWVGSDHVRAAIAAAVTKPVFKFPVPIARPWTAPVDRTSMGIPPGRFAFLFSFNFWSVFARKNPLGLIDAFSRGFSPNEGPVLVLKTVRGSDFPRELASMREAAAKRPDVFVIDRKMGRTEYGGLVSACDAYASLHRAEGFGLTIAEAMALGKPAVATGYSGNLAFMTDENSFLVPHTLVPIPPDTEPYIAGGHWAEPDVAAAAVLMRSVVEQPSVAAMKSRTALSDLNSRHDFDAAATFIRERLAESPEPHHPPHDPVERAAAEVMWGPDLEAARPWPHRIRRLARPVLRPYVDHQRRVAASILEALRETRDGQTPRDED